MRPPVMRGTAYVTTTLLGTAGVALWALPPASVTTEVAINANRTVQGYTPSLAFSMPAFEPHPASGEVSRSRPIVAASASPPVVVSTTTSTTLAATHQAVVAAAGYPPGYSSACYPSVGMSPRNSTEACISSREHGGCYDASANPSHVGRWQLSETLFYEYGGAQQSGWSRWQSWKYSSPAMQDQVFRNVVAADGYGNWTPYDGC